MDEKLELTQEEIKEIKEKLRFSKFGFYPSRCVALITFHGGGGCISMFDSKETVEALKKSNSIKDFTILE